VSENGHVLWSQQVQCTGGTGQKLHSLNYMVTSS